MNVKLPSDSVSLHYLYVYFILSLQPRICFDPLCNGLRRCFCLCIWDFALAFRWLREAYSDSMAVRELCGESHASFGISRTWHVLCLLQHFFSPPDLGIVVDSTMRTVSCLPQGHAYLCFSASGLSEIVGGHSVQGYIQPGRTEELTLLRGSPQSWEWELVTQCIPLEGQI